MHTMTTHSPRPSQARRANAALVLGFAVAALVLAACSSAVAADPSPSVKPTPVATPIPAPSDGGGDAMPLTVDLESVTGADVEVDIVDRTGGLLSADSGSPVDGASVEPYTIQVENLDDRTLRLTWVDYPIDNKLALFIDETSDGLRFVLVQPEPTGPTDSISVDRILELTFDSPVSADDVEAFLQDGLDTPG
jgi:hypothetical protein